MTVAMAERGLFFEPFWRRSPTRLSVVILAALPGVGRPPLKKRGFPAVPGPPPPCHRRVTAESGQYKIRSLDLNNRADQEMLIRMLDPNGTANRDELIRTAIDLDKRFKATNLDLAAAGLQPVNYTTPNNIHFTVMADYGVKSAKVPYRF